MCFFFHKKRKKRKKTCISPLVLSIFVALELDLHMKDVSALVTAIEYKLDLIMKQNKELKKQMLELKTKNESLTAELQLKQEEKDELYKENQILLLNKGALRKQDSEKAKKNINDFIREIDKCIALLNE